MRRAVDTADFEDCFTQFDAAFESLTTQFALDPQDPTPVDLERAFTVLDEQLATCQAPDSALKRVAVGRAKESDGRAETHLQLSEQSQSITRALRPIHPAIRRDPVSGGLSPLANVLAVLENLTVVQRRLASGTSMLDDPSSREAVLRVFADARQLCIDFDLQTARVRADFALAVLEEGQFNRLHAEIEELFRHIRHDVRFCSIWPVAPERAWSFEDSFGDGVKQAFPSAQSDITEGGVCLGLGRHSACVFHMTRAAERAVRALARAASTDAALRGGDEWSGWLAIVEKRLSDISRWSAGHAKQNAQTFFERGLADARVLSDAVRRLTALGPTHPFDEQEASAIYQRTKALLVRLSERISEQQKKTLTRHDFAR